MKNLFCIAFIFFISVESFAQEFVKTKFYTSDSTTTNDYYISCVPKSFDIKGTLVILTGSKPEDVFQESKLQNVAYDNDILSIIISTGNKLAADSLIIQKLNSSLADIVKRFSLKSDQVILGGHGTAGSIAVRYSELCYQYPAQYPVKPKGVFAINAFLDLANQWQFYEREIANNKPFAGEAKYFLDQLTSNYGDIKNNADLYSQMSPFSQSRLKDGNEFFLKNVAVRFYYDVDVDWYIKERQRSLYDTGIPEASEFIVRLQNVGNTRAEFISSRQKGVKSNGVRNVNAWSVIDEVECIKWIKDQLDIIDPNHYNPHYDLVTPTGWNKELILFPIDFAPRLGFTKGIEDLRFPPGFNTATSDEYWSYAFVWVFNESIVFDAKMLTEKLRTYYSGLVELNVVNRKIDREKVIPVSCVVKNVDNGNKAFIATVKMLDYKTLKPMILNLKLMVKKSTPEQSYLFVGISPQSLSGKMWQKLDALNFLFDEK